MFCHWQCWFNIFAKVSAIGNANLTLFQRYAADNFETTHEQGQQLKNPKVFLEDSLEEEEGNEENIE